MLRKKARRPRATIPIFEAVFGEPRGRPGGRTPAARDRDDARQPAHPGRGQTRRLFCRVLAAKQSAKLPEFLSLPAPARRGPGGGGGGEGGKEREKARARPLPLRRRQGRRRRIMSPTGGPVLPKVNAPAGAGTPDHPALTQVDGLPRVPRALEGMRGGGGGGGRGGLAAGWRTMPGNPAAS